jgi:hypothetical protein
MFMFDCVPEPVCQTTSGNSSGHLPASTSSAAAGMSCAFSAVSAPRDRFTTAAARFAGERLMSRAACARWRCENAQRALRLRTPEPVGGHFDRAKGVFSVRVLIVCVLFNQTKKGTT